MTSTNYWYGTLFAIMTIAAWCGRCGTADAQNNVVLNVVLGESRYPRRVPWAIHDPFYAITSRVYAQAELIRAQGDAAVSFGHARGLNAEAYSKELDNWMKELRVYWDRKVVAEKKKLELDEVRKIKKLRYLNDRKWPYLLR